MGETYDVIQRNQPSSKPTQKLLSETDPSYGKLDKVHNCDNLFDVVCWCAIHNGFMRSYL